jgi:hypothetical protein
MLGQLVVFRSGGTECIEISDTISPIVVDGVRVEAKVEEKGLRLSKLTIVSNKIEQHGEQVLNRAHVLNRRKEDLENTNRELKEIQSQMLCVDQGERKALFEELDLKAEIKRNHEREIERMESQSTIGVSFQVVKSGVFKVLAPDVIKVVDFLPNAVSWCPTETGIPFEEVENKYEEMPLSLTSAEHTTASGSGLESCLANQESTFVIVAKDFQGRTRDSGGDTFVVESKDGDLKSAVVDKSNGTYEVSYHAGEHKAGAFSLSVTLYGRPIRGSPFGVAVYKPCTGVFNRLWGSNGSGQGQLKNPRGVAVAGQEVYVADESNHRIQVFSTGGSFLRMWGSNGSGQGHL